MNCIREAENYLRYYRELHQSIDHARYMIGQLMSQTAPSDASAVKLDSTGVRSSRPINTLNQMYQLQKWQEMKEKTQAEIDKVDRVLELISRDTGCERYKDVLFMWYVEKRDKDDIAYELGYSHRQSAYELKNKAIKRFAVALFGIVALEAI